MGCTCCKNGNSALNAEAKDIISITGKEKEKTIPILQEIQSRKGYIPEDLLNEVSEVTGIAVSDFYSVATFYSQFRFTPLGKHLIRVCNGTACFVSGADILFDTLSDLLKVGDGETTEDGLFTLETVACLGCCSLAPVVMISGRVYGKQNSDSIRKLVNSIIADEAKGEKAAAAAAGQTGGTA